MVSRRDTFIRVCARCPQSYTQWTGRTSQPLCVDCRYVLSQIEREMWAA